MPDPLTALVADARTVGGPVAVPFRGGTLTIPDIHGWPLTALDAVAAQRWWAWARTVLDGADWARFRAADPTNRECRALLAAWGERTGEDIATITRLVGMLREYAGPLESDLVAYCGGQDLRHLFQPGGGPGRLTWRRLGSMVDGLPGHSATKTAIRDALGDEKLAELSKQGPRQHGQWSHEALRLAAIEDVANRILWRVMQATSQDPGKIPFPEPVARPGVIPRAQRRLTPQGRAYLQYLRDHRGQAPPGTKSLGRVGG